LAKARSLGRSVKYLTSGQINKEEIAWGIAAKEGIRNGLVCVLSCLEACWSFDFTSTGRRSWSWSRATESYPVPDHLAQPRIFPQPLEVIEALATHRIQNHRALHHRRFVAVPFPLPDPRVRPHTGRQSQRAERLHHQRHATHGGECFRQWLRLDLDQQRRFGWRRFAGLLHLFILPAHPPGAKQFLDPFPHLSPPSPIYQSSAASHS